MRIHTCIQTLHKAVHRCEWSEMHFCAITGNEQVSHVLGDGSRWGREAIWTHEFEQENSCFCLKPSQPQPTSYHNKGSEHPEQVNWKDCKKTPNTPQHRTWKKEQNNSDGNICSRLTIASIWGGLEWQYRLAHVYRRWIRSVAASYLLADLIAWNKAHHKWPWEPLSWWPSAYKSSRCRTK